MAVEGDNGAGQAIAQTQTKDTAGLEVEDGALGLPDIANAPGVREPSVSNDVGVTAPPDITSAPKPQRSAGAESGKTGMGPYTASNFCR